MLHDRVLGSLGRRLLMTSTQEPNTMAPQSALCICWCLENSDLENSDPRPEKLRPSGVSKTQTPKKLRPSGVSKTQTPKKLRPSGVSKTQTQKTQTLGCLENSDPKNSDPLGVSKTQTRKIKHLHRVNAASRLVYCSSIRWHYDNLPRKEKQFIVS